MRNGGLPPAHLPSPPHFNHVANILADLADLKAIVSKYATRARLEDERRRQQLLDEQAACARQEAAIACARQEAAAARDPPGRASQDAYDAYDDYDDYDNEYDDDKYDEYNDKEYNE